MSYYYDGPTGPTHPYLGPDAGFFSGDQLEASRNAQAAAEGLGQVGVNAHLQNLANNGASAHTQQQEAWRLAEEARLSALGAQAQGQAFAAYASSGGGGSSTEQDVSFDQSDPLSSFNQWLGSSSNPQEASSPLALEGRTILWGSQQPGQIRDTGDVPTGIIEGTAQPRNLQELIRAGRYDFVHEWINESNFPLGNMPIDLSEVKYGQFDNPVNTSEVFEWMKDFGVRPVTMSELLLYGVRYAHVQRNNPVIALGSRLTKDGIEYVGCLRGNETYRSVELYPVDNDSLWSESCHFLNLPKPKPGSVPNKPQNSFHIPQDPGVPTHDPSRTADTEPVTYTVDYGVDYTVDYWVDM